MDERRVRILDDLRGLISGELRFDAVGRAPYARDAGLHEIDPLGVVAPRSNDELVTLIRYAADRGIPIHARGAGTGFAGESLGPGLVVDFSRHLRRVLEVGPDFIVVQPGAVIDELNALLAPRGRRLGPDPGGSESCTVGGLVAGNSAGSRSLKYGTTIDHLLSMQVVFADGETARLGHQPWPDGEDDSTDTKGHIAHRIGRLLRWHADLIARGRPAAPRNRAGYALWAVASTEGIDLSKLVVGSEGTLALVTEATLRTVPIPPASGVLVLPFARLADAAEAVALCLESAPTSLELVDWRRLSLAREADPAYRCLLPETAEAALVVEFETADASEAVHAVKTLADRALRSTSLVAAPIEPSRREDQERLLDLRRAVMPLLGRSLGRVRPIPLVEDVAVPPESLPEYLRSLERIFKDYGVAWTVHSHAGHGQVHARPFLDPSDPEYAARLEPMAADVYESALALGGTISGEHGCGLLRSQFLKRQYGDLAAVFAEVKAIFDPKAILNPGKIVADDPHLLVRHLRTSIASQDAEPRSAVANTSAEPAPPGLPVLNDPLLWPDRDRIEQIESCNGCGACRSLEPSLRMCPAFRARRSETASPRAQVNILHMIASGAVDPKQWGSDELRANSGLCVHCTRCRTECPSGIDVSSLMIEAKAAYAEQHGLAPSDWMLSRVETWSRWMSRFPLVANTLSAHRLARWALERLVGLSRHRVLPRVRRRTFLTRAEGLGLTRPRPQQSGPRVAYFVDVFANHFDPELAESTVAVLRHVGVNVYVPKAQRGCGMPSLVAGDLDTARRLVLQNIRALADAVRDGYTVVCSEPTAALVLTQEARKLTDDLDADLVARHTMDVGQFLKGLADRVGLPPFTQPILARVGYHQPCHLRALGAGAPGMELLRAIPGLEVDFIDRGCSGIAGTYGFTRADFRNSLRAGRGLRRRLRDPDIEIGATECGTCRMQMEQGVTKRTHHPIKLLALAYGLAPALRQVYKDPKHKHVIS